MAKDKPKTPRAPSFRTLSVTVELTKNMRRGLKEEGLTKGGAEVVLAAVLGSRLNRWASLGRDAVAMEKADKKAAAEKRAADAKANRERKAAEKRKAKREKLQAALNALDLEDGPRTPETDLEEGQ